MFTISLRRVRDRVRVALGGEALVLRVDADPASLVSDLRAARQRLESLGPHAPSEERLQAARALAAAVFGEGQAEDLCALCGGDPSRVVSVCADYFDARLRRRIARVQRRLP